MKLMKDQSNLLKVLGWIYIIIGGIQTVGCVLSLISKNYSNMGDSLKNMLVFFVIIVVILIIDELRSNKHE